MNSTTTGIAIRNIRKMKKITLREAADSIGVSVGTFRKIESGAVQLDTLTAVKLGLLFGINAEYFVFMSYLDCVHMGLLEMSELMQMLMCERYVDKQMMKAVSLYSRLTSEARVSVDAFMKAAANKRLD